MTEFENSNANDSENLVQEFTSTKTLFIINLDDEIKLPSEYRKAFFIFNKATKNDTIKLIINSYGGATNTAVQFFNLLIDTPAHTIADIYTACSAGSIIALGCNEINIRKFATMMIHQSSWGINGKAEEIKSQSDFFTTLNKKILEDIYFSFLSQKEIKEILKGKDFWFFETEIKKRLETWIPYCKRNV